MWQFILLCILTVLLCLKCCSTKLWLRVGLIHAAKVHEQSTKVYVVHMSSALNGSSALQNFECNNAVEMHNGIMFHFYAGLSHVILLSSRYFYNSIFLSPCRAISHDIAWRGCYSTGVTARTLGLCSILATTMCFN